MHNFLESIFPVSPVPRPSEIVIPYEGDSDRTALRAALASKFWTSVDFQSVRNLYPGPISEAFSYLTPHGKAYFFPAFIQFCRSHPQEVDDLADAMLYPFVHPDSRSYELLNILSKHQKEFVISFFEEQFSSIPSHAKDLASAKMLLLENKV